jgi:tetratricopeptide (TPR) repeat protein
MGPARNHGYAVKKKYSKPGRNESGGIFGPSGIPVWTAALAIALASLLVYANSLDGRFVFDDTVIVQGNEAIQGLDGDHLSQIFGQHYWKQVESRGGLYRPVVMLSYALNYAIGEEDPQAYHLLNIVIHAFNGILVFFVLEALFSRRLLSFLTALFFVLHPIRTEGVASIVGRAESLSALFALSAWMLYIQAWREKRQWYNWAGALCLILAVLSKESAFAFIALLPLTDFLIGTGRWRDRFSGVVRRYLPYGLALLTVLMIRYRVLGGFTPLYISPRSNPLALVPAWPRFLTATSVFGRYLALLLVPLGLSADYSSNQIPVITSILDWRAATSLVVLLLSLIGTVLSIRRHPVLFFSGFVFFSSFLLTSNWIRPIGTIMAERLMYFPSLGFNCAMAFLFVEGISREKWRRAVVSAGAVVLAAYAILTIGRNPDWKDHYSLFRSAARNSPESSLVQSNFAAVLLNEKQDSQGAAEHARKAVSLYPDDPAAWFTLGQACRNMGNAACAAQAFAEVVRLAPRTSGGTQALREKAEMEESTGNLASARVDYEQLGVWTPSDPGVFLAIARVLTGLGDRAGAEEALRKAGRLAPSDPGVLRALREHGLMR